MNKKTGVEVDNILMANTKPVYDIDAVNDYIYYSVSSEMQILRFK